ncbi:MAG: hypothetical protein WBM17_01970 [Anaerolineales bacterium]
MRRTLMSFRSVGMFGLILFALGCSFFSSGAATQAPQGTVAKTAVHTPGSAAAPTGEPSPVVIPELKDMGRIAFSSIRENGLPDIYLMNADGGDVKLLAGTPGETDLHPVWSPDGEWIAFIGSGEGGTFDVFRIRPDGSGLINLTNNPADESFFDWSPDGSQIVFSSDRSGNYDLYTMHADGSNAKQLTKTGDQDEVEPAWSPNGDVIGCLCGPSDGNAGDICLVNADGSGETNLTPDDPDVDDFIWSPDGSRIAFGMPIFPEEIWMMGADGSGKDNLSNNPADDGGIAFSPDGTMIAFRSDRDGKTNQIYILRLEDSFIYPLTDNELVNVQPAWSPDGTWVVFISAKSLGEFDFEIYAVRVDGEGLANLTNNPGKDMDPDWEPI